MSLRNEVWTEKEIENFKKYWRETFIEEIEKIGAELASIDPKDWKIFYGSAK